jgi:hypothetical protein
MIDGQRRHPTASRDGPVVSEQAERHAVRAAGNSDGQMRRIFEWSEPFHRRREFGDDGVPADDRQRIRDS